MRGTTKTIHATACLLETLVISNTVQTQPRSGIDFSKCWQLQKLIVNMIPENLKANYLQYNQDIYTIRQGAQAVEINKFIVLSFTFILIIGCSNKDRLNRNPENLFIIDNSIVTERLYVYKNTLGSCCGNHYLVDIHSNDKDSVNVFDGRGAGRILVRWCSESDIIIGVESISNYELRSRVFREPPLNIDGSENVLNVRYVEFSDVDKCNP